MIYSLLFLLAITIVGSGLSIWIRHERDAADVIDSVIAYYMLSFVGIAGVFAFLGHTFQADSIAESLGWPAGNPFQFEVGVANLAYGVAGLLCFHWRGGFRWATAIFTAVFFWGATVGHIHELVANNNHNAGNAGAALYIDILVPLVLFGLLIAEEVLQRRQTQTEALPRQPEVRHAV